MFSSFKRPFRPIVISRLVSSAMKSFQFTKPEVSSSAKTNPFLLASVAVVLMGASAGGKNCPKDPVSCSRWAADTVGTPKLRDIYQISDDVIGQGGYCIVRKGIHRQTGEIVAIKELCKRQTSAKDFWAEVDMLRIAGKNKNIMSLLGVYETDESWYIVQEMASDGELFDHLVKNGAYSEKEASAALQNLCNAISHLHRKGIVHGDIKPENILRHKNQLCLVDFGVSFRLGEKSHDGLIGTMGYCAPESLTSENGKYNQGPEADMFSFGVVMFILLCGFHPFDRFNNLTDEEVKSNIINGSFKIDKSTLDFLSDDAVSLLRGLLEVDPTKRLTATDALNHPWLRPESNLSTLPLHDSAEHLKKFQRGRRRLRASILAVLLHPDILPSLESKNLLHLTSTKDLVTVKNKEKKKKTAEELSWGISSKPDAVLHKTEAVMSAVSLFDKDNKGYISESDLSRVASDLGEKLTQNEIMEVMSAADGDPHTSGIISYEDVKMAICQLRSANFENGDTIIREGEKNSNDTFYFLMDGVVEKNCQNPVKQAIGSSSSNSKIALSRISKGEYFGEVELLCDNFCSRISSYRCVSPVCKVLQLPKSDLFILMADYEVIEDKIRQRINLQLGNQLVETLNMIDSSKIEHFNYAPGDIIHKLEDEVDSLYIVIEGEIKIKSTVDGTNFSTGIFHTGDVYPVGFLTRGPTNEKSSAKCLKPSKLVKIDGKTFREFIKRPCGISQYFLKYLE